VESSATRVRVVRQWGGGGGTKASKGGRKPGNWREPTTIPPDVSLSSITRTPYRDLTTFLTENKITGIKNSHVETYLILYKQSK